MLKRQQTTPSGQSLGYIRTAIDLSTMKAEIEVKDDQRNDPAVEKQMHEVACNNLAVVIREANESRIQVASAVAHPNHNSLSTARMTSLSNAIELFAEERLAGNQWTTKTEKENRAILAVLAELLGEGTAIGSITIDALTKVKHQVMKLPTNLTKKYKGKSLKQALEMKDAKTLSESSIKKYLIRFKSFFKWANDNGYSAVNAEGPFRFRTSPNPKKLRKQFQQKQLAIIFDPSTYPTSNARGHEWRYWLPILALYTGCRLNELCQLYTDDVAEVDGVYCIRVCGGRDDQRVKSGNSERYVPVHSFLIKLGFKRFVESRKTERLWPSLKPNEMNGYGNAPSRWFARYLKKVGITDKQLVFHSFRHCFSTASGSRSGALIANTLCGRAADKSTLNDYYHGAPLTILQEAIEKITFDTPLLIQATK